MELVRYADRPDLREIRLETLSRRTFPEFMHHNQSGTRFWGRLYDEQPDFQLALLDGADLVAELHWVPMPWDGSLDDLPTGWDDGFARAFESDREANVLCALAISVRPDRQGSRLSSRMLNAMRDAAREGGLRGLLAPVRPTLKERYPLIPIERYVDWRREDGAHFDPWCPPPRARRRRDPGTCAAVDGDRGTGRRLGGMDRDELPRRRHLRRAGDARAARGAGRCGSARRAEHLAPAHRSSRSPTCHHRSTVQRPGLDLSVTNLWAWSSRFRRTAATTR